MHASRTSLSPGKIVLACLACGLLAAMPLEEKETTARKAAKEAGGAVQVDKAIAKYKPVSGVSGTLKSVGSDTMNNLMALWTAGFKKHYPGVNVEVEGKGSATAPPALTEGTAQFGPMSREMKSDEIDKFEKKFGYKPTMVKTGVDVLAVYVHKDNPLKSLSLQQIDAIFSKTRRGGAKSEIKTWGDLGLGGEWADKPISLYGRNSASGTYGYFKEHALFKGDYKDEVKEQPGSAAVVQGVASDKYAIGYSGIGYKTADVRAVAVAAKDAGKPHEANMDNAYSGDYPIARYLLVYVNKDPQKSLDPLRLEFLKYALSHEGQEEVVKDGYIPLPAKIISEELKKIGAGS
jgi:phosphate transport system substrate-binding protein